MKILKIVFVVLILFVIPSRICFAEIAWERVYEAEVDGKILSGAYFGGITRSIPAFVDIDGDNDYDMFYGAYYGRLLYFRNDGTSASPTWTFVTENYVPETIHQCSPEFVDIDNDGDYDLFIGDYYGNLHYYRNDGDASNPVWTYVTDNYGSIAVESKSMPAFADIDNDGDYDLFIGEDDGNINYYRNDGTPEIPTWTLITETYESINVGDHSCPVFVDIDNDNDLDMFIGELWDDMYYYRNDGTASAPSWTYITDEYVDVSDYYGIVPEFVDIDNDGDFDLFVGEYDTTSIYFRNDGSAETASFSLTTENYEVIDVGKINISTFADIDADGDYDMFIGFDYDMISVLNEGDIFTPSWSFSSVWDNPAGGQCTPFFVDIDNDDDLDLFFGDSDGKIYYYQNNGDSENASFTLITDNYEMIDVGRFSRQTFVDIDADGDYDMFIGEQDGNLNYYRNDGTAESPAWTFISANYTLSSKPCSAPFFTDVDNDGDFDLFIGDLYGTISFYRNIGTAFIPEWQLISDNYMAIDVGDSSTPTFCDINNDGNIDMFISEGAGGINHWLHAGFTSYPELSWSGQDNYLTDGVHPEIGSSATIFIFSVDYTDANNNPPKRDFPKIHIKKGGIEITGSPFTMQETNSTDTNYTNGKLYEYSVSGLTMGTDYTYYFEAYDIWNAPATGTPLNPIDSPDITLYYINGTIADLEKPISGVSVSLGGGSSDIEITDSNGYYAFTDLSLGATYTVTPAKKHYIFIPESIICEDLDGSYTYDFTAVKIWSEDYSDIIVFPNPWNSNDGQDSITLANLTENSLIRIYTITGELIFEKESAEIDFKWNPENDSGDSIASGVYIYMISNPAGAHKIGKIAIIK